MNDTIDTAIKILELLFSVGSVSLAVYVNYVAQSRVNKSASEIYERLNRQGEVTAERLNGHADRLTKLEARVAHLPHGDDVHKIAITCTELVGEIKALKVELKGMAEMHRVTDATVRRVEGYIVDHAKD